MSLHSGETFDTAGVQYSYLDMLLQITRWGRHTICLINELFKAWWRIDIQ
jgi:hypothetical protein